MALTVELGVAELAATRFAISPLSETVSALQQLAGRDRRATNLRWLRWAADEITAEPLELTRTWPLIVTDRPSWPEFVVPAPTGPGTTIDDDLAALRRTTARQVRTSLDRVYGDDLPPEVAELRARPSAGLRAVAAELRAAHDRLIAPHWPRIRAVLDADITYRATQLARGGAQRLFADLHPDLHWSDGRLVMTAHQRQPDRVVNRGPGGLVLIPVVLGPPHVLIKGNTSTQTTLRALPGARGRRALDRGDAGAGRHRRRTARAHPRRTARGSALTGHDDRPGPRLRGHAQCRLAASRRPARERPRRPRTIGSRRPLPDDRARHVPARCVGTRQVHVTCTVGV